MMESNVDPLDDPSADEAFARRRSCCCCCFPFSSPWERVQAPAPAGGDGGGLRARALVMKAREWSELAAGPRWKTFLRRFGRNSNRGRPGGLARFQYDPLSYTLNFDEGPGGGDSSSEGYDAGGRDFSARFAAPPPAAARSPVDLGGRDGPPPFSGGG